MSEVRLAAEARTEFGKGFARRARKAGKVPAVLYGHGTAPVHLALDAHEFGRAIRGGSNTVLVLDMAGGASEMALPKSVVRHPLRDYVEHVDLVIVRRGERVTVDVPVTVVGEAGPDTTVLLDASTLSVEADALSIPASLEVSVEGLQAGAQITAEQVELPAGVTLSSDAELLVVGVSAAITAAQLDAETAAAEEEAGVVKEEHTEPGADDTGAPASES